MTLRAVATALALLVAAPGASLAQSTPASPPAGPAFVLPAAPPPALVLPAAPAEPPPANADLAYGAYQRGLYLTAFQEATRRVEADPNDAAAMTLIGELYANGLGIRQDWAKAADWYRLASQRGDPQASYALAMQMLDGRGLARNAAEGRRLLAVAADKVPGAAYTLALLLLEDKKPESDRRAAELMRFAADSSDTDAQYAMALLYRQGRGVEKDPSEMLLWMARAAGNRSAAAEVDYGIMLFNGDFVPRNEAGAARFFQRAAERGNAVAQNRLARMYAAGRGVPKNVVEAAKWHLLASDRGLADGYLDQVLRDMSPDDRARAEDAARKWRGS